MARTVMDEIQQQWAAQKTRANADLTADELSAVALVFGSLATRTKDMTPDSRQRVTRAVVDALTGVHRQQLQAVESVCAFFRS